MTVEPAALEDVLAALEVRLGRTARTDLAPGGLLPLANGAVTLVYVVDGEITGEAEPDSACTLDAPAGAAAPAGGRRTLLAGDAFLTMGRGGTVLESVSGARLVTVELELVAAPATRAVPDVVFVTGFAALEPAGAALAANLAPLAGAPRSGDPLICRMMITTVLLSVIRAWTQLGGAPAGWPAAADPYLQRVVAAIHDEPGRDWSLDRLASIGAMSRTVLAERFRAELGSTPATYVAEVRMELAKRLLDAGRPVSEVSRELGYHSDEGFSRAFRRRTGVVPSAWRTGDRLARTA